MISLYYFFFAENYSGVPNKSAAPLLIQVIFFPSNTPLLGATRLLNLTKISCQYVYLEENIQFIKSVLIYISAGSKSKLKQLI